MKQLRWVVASIGVAVLLGIASNSTYANVANGLFAIISQFSAEFSDLFSSANTQFAAHLCALFIFFSTFFLLQTVLPRAYFARRGWLLIFVFVAFLRYLADRRDSQLYFAQLLTGLTVGLAAASYVAWPLKSKIHWRFRLKKILRICFGIAFALAIISPPTQTRFYYLGANRWAGIWNSPNTAGLLIGTVVIFSLAYIMCMDKRSHFKLYFFLSLLIAATSLLIKTYSRGALLGVGCGIAYLAYNLWRSKSFGPWITRRSIFAFLLVSASFGALTIIKCQDISQSHIRRAFSVANNNDFSSRNRLAAYEASLQMIADKPLTGYGWGQSEPLYYHFYQPERQVDIAGSELNIYLYLGIIAGLPCMICFVTYLLVSLLHGGDRLYNPRTSAWIFEPSVRQPLQLACRASSIVLAVGFTFDGGLFLLWLAIPYWILLEIGCAELPLDKISSQTSPDSEGAHLALQHPKKWNFLCLLLPFAFIGAMMCAKSRFPFSLQEINFPVIHQMAMTGIIVQPKAAKKFPVVIYAHGSGEKWQTDGLTLRQFSKLGFMAMAFDYDQTSFGVFDEQFSALLDYVNRQTWAKTNSIVWVGSSLGAQQILRFALIHPERQPNLLVRLSGGWVPELDSFEKVNLLEDKANPIQHRNMKRPSEAGLISFFEKREKIIRCPVLIVHGENDDRLPLEDTKRLAQLLQTNGIPTDLKILQGTGHDFAPNRAEVIRLVAEYCKAKLTPEHPLPEFTKLHPYPFWACMMPAVGWLGFCYYRHRRKASLAGESSHGISEIATAASEGYIDKPSLKWRRFEIGLRITAIILAVLAATQTAYHLILPRLAITDKTLALARHSLVPLKWQEDFAILSALPIWPGHTIKTLLENVELSHYTVNELINWKVDTDKYLDYVLNPVIAGDKTELNWRRELWLNFYPRIKHEDSPDSAAEIVVRFLRERVTVAPGYPKQPGVESIWNGHIANLDDFEIVYTAALRSVGVPARLSAARQTEYWTGAEWKAAPRPVAMTWVES